MQNVTNSGAELLAIQVATGANEHNCTCSKCESMCHKCPCLGTPADILKLINHGHVLNLVPTVWATAVFFNRTPIYMIQAKKNPDGSCIFLSRNRCTLHAAGLKPTEGRLASHDPLPGKPLPLAVAQTWENPKNSKTIELIVKALSKC